MESTSPCYQAYCAILREELIPAMGCTEPIAIAYGASYARDLLGRLPESLTLSVSGNLIKNVKSVVVPNTGGLRGIPAAAAAGVVAGRTERLLEVIREVSPQQKEEIAAYLQTHPITVELKDTPLTFDCLITAAAGEDVARVRIANFHTNVVLAEVNGEKRIDRKVDSEQEVELTDRSVLNIRDILDFARTVRLEDVSEVLERQIQYNSAIAQEGIRGDYGANVGSVLLEVYGDDVKNRARAMAAAGSDARMNGCEMPVVIVSGSGNQGITASVPVIEFARDMDASHEQLLRALVVSNLVTIHQKTPIGRLSAFCGAVSAGAGAACGICFLRGGDYDDVAHTLVNALAVSSGIVCDGAKASCAAKIDAALEGAFLAHKLAMSGYRFPDGEGIVQPSADQTVCVTGRLGRDGMRQTDIEILNIMLGH